jgi:hypothetical protein
MEKKPKAFTDLLGIALGAVAVFAVSATFDIFNKIIGWIYRHDTWQLDELFTVAVYLVFAIAFYAWRRNTELRDHVRQREEIEAENARLLPELEGARSDLTILRTLLPLCSLCGRVRENNGNWAEVEDYLEKHYGMRLDDGLCPECAREHYGRSVRS